MDTTKYERAVEHIERILADYTCEGREEALCVLLKVTVNAIHVIEQKELRQRVEREYIKALTFLSAVEEQCQVYAVNEPPTDSDLVVDGMMRETFKHLWATRRW